MKAESQVFAFIITRDKIYYNSSLKYEKVIFHHIIN